MTDVSVQPTTASEWKEKSRKGSELRLPSGNVCLVRKASGMQMFVRNGQIPNSLLHIVDKEMNKGKPESLQQQELTKLLADPDSLTSILELLDNVTVSIVMAPEVRPIPYHDPGKEIPLEDREEGDFLYVDEVDMEDKMFIFNWAVGGTADWEQFRQQLHQPMEPVLGSKDVELPSEFPPPNYR